MDIYYRYIEYSLDRFLDQSVNLDEIRSCLFYSVKGGKKIRSLIYLLVLDQVLLKEGKALTDIQRQLMNDGFMYVELIHTASLILDDMPHMDNDLTRRGEPTVHVKFGKGKAQLAAFILIQLAHQHLARTFTQLYKDTAYLTSDQYVELHLFLDRKEFDFLGERGLAGGQYLDLYQMSDATLDGYMKMIEYKTSRLFEASFVLPYCLVNSNKELSIDQFEKYRKFGCQFGLIFQLLDDLVDGEQDGSTGNNILDYVDVSTALEKVKDLYHDCICLSEELGLDLSDIWNLLEEKSPHFNIVYRSLNSSIK